MTTRPRLSDKDLCGREDLIALMIRIQQETRALSLDLDVDTLTYVHRRLTSIIESAGRAKEIAIAKMYQDKDAAQNGRR